MSATKSPPPSSPIGTTEAAGAAAQALCALMTKLRADDGCPWDRDQDLHSLRPFLIEEAHEVLEVLDGLTQTGEGDWEAHRDELGDLLFQVVFQAELQREAGRFGFAEVAKAIHDKLVRRHPHVFPPEGQKLAEHDPGRWERIKAQEKAEARARQGDQAPEPSALDGVPAALPALTRAFRQGQKARRVGFDWPDTSGVLAKVHEELGELEQTLEPFDRKAFEHEVGDLLYAIVNLCRHVEVDPEAALRGCMTRFRERFRRVEKSLTDEGMVPTDVDLDDLEARWQTAKKQIAQEGDAES